MPRAALTDLELEATRRRLSAAALAIYREEGQEAVTFRRIAEALRISHTRAYRYFDNKDALMARVRVEAMQRLSEHVLRRSPTQPDILKQMRDTILAFVEFGRAHPQDYLLIFASHQPAPTLFPELLAARRALFDHAVGIAQRAIDHGVIAGDARRFAHIVWSQVHGLMTLHTANQLVHGYDLDALVPAMIDHLLGTRRAGDAATPITASRGARATRG